MAIKINPTNMNSLVSEYAVLRDQKKQIEARMKVLSDRIKSYAQAHGVVSDTGSSYCENDSYYFGSVAKKSISFDQSKAVEFLKSKGFYKAVKTTETVDEEALERYIADGSITSSDIESITVVKTTYSLDVKKKDEITDVRQIPLAASRRGRK